MRQRITSYVRFSSPDPFAGSAKATDPQTLDRYSYVSNNPLNASDPTGDGRGLPTATAACTTGNACPAAAHATATGSSTMT
jgi:hypothetical protein